LNKSGDKRVMQFTLYGLKKRDYNKIRSALITNDVNLLCSALFSHFKSTRKIDADIKKCKIPIDKNESVILDTINTVEDLERLWKT